MLKQNNIITYALFFFITLNPHGFGHNTLISLANHYYQTIDNLSAYAQANNSYPSVLSYNEKIKKHTTHKVKSVATGTANCYCAIGFDKQSTCPDIICTPDQEFYLAIEQLWVPAYQLHTNDALLTKDNLSIPITHIEFIHKPIDVFILEITKTHTFFVGKHAILTHNIILPLGISMGIPFGCATGGTIGSFFGPITCTVGVIAGTLIGAIITVFNDNTIPTYKLPHYDISYINQQRGDLFHLNDKSNEAQAPGKPTKNDGFESPKRSDGKKVQHPKTGRYGWPDKSGNVWAPSGPNGHGAPHWDVQFPDGDYVNVMPGGYIRGTKRKFNS